MSLLPTGTLLSIEELIYRLAVPLIKYVSRALLSRRYSTLSMEELMNRVAVLHRTELRNRRGRRR